MARTRKSTARRYAEAAFEIAERDGNVDGWLTQLAELAQVVADGDIVRRLEDPQIPIEQRLEVFHAALGKAAIPQLINLVRLVLRRRRVETIGAIYREFRRLYNRRAGIVEAFAVSAAPLQSQEQDALRARLEQISGGRIELDMRVDAALLGGVQVRLGDLLIDGSVRGRLERLRNRLASGALTP